MSKYDEYLRGPSMQNLTALGGQAVGQPAPQTQAQQAMPALSTPAFAPPTPSVGTPPEGALQPRPQGAGGTAFGPLKEKEKGKKKGMSFYDIWKDGDAEAKEQIANEMETTLKAGGQSMETKAAELASAQPEEAKKYKGKDGKWGRKEWGAFLFEMGLRTLSSGQDDAAGAMAEGALGTMAAQRGRKMEDEDRAKQDKKDKEAAERAKSQDERADAEAKRKQEEYEYNKSRRADKEKRLENEGWERVTTKDGSIAFVKRGEKAVYAEDEEGNIVKTSDPDKVSAAQQEVNRRSDEQLRVKAEASALRELDDDREYKRLDRSTDPKDKKKAEQMLKSKIEEKLDFYKKGFEEDGDDPFGIK